MQLFFVEIILYEVSKYKYIIRRSTIFYINHSLFTSTENTAANCLEPWRELRWQLSTYTTQSLIIFCCSWKIKHSSVLPLAFSLCLLTEVFSLNLAPDKNPNGEVEKFSGGEKWSCKWLVVGWETTQLYCKSFSNSQSQNCLPANIKTI